MQATEEFKNNKCDQILVYARLCQSSLSFVLFIRQPVSLSLCALKGCSQMMLALTLCSSAVVNMFWKELNFYVWLNKIKQKGYLR